MGMSDATTGIPLPLPLSLSRIIETRYLGPTDYRGSRIVVRSTAGRMVVPWDHAIDAAANHDAAAAAYAARQGWEWRAARRGNYPTNAAGYVYSLAIGGES